MGYSAYEQEDDRERFLALQLRNAWGKGVVTLIEPRELHGGIMSKRQLVAKLTERSMNSPTFQASIKQDVMKMLTALGKKDR